MPQRSSSNTSYAKSAVLATVAVVLALGGYFFIDNYFRVKKIEVVAENNNPSEYAVKSLNTLGDYNLVLSSQKEAVNFLKKGNPVLKEIRLKEQFPDKITVAISFHTPFAYVEAIKGFITVSQDGTVLASGSEKSAGLPLISYYQKISSQQYSIGRKIDFEEIKTALLLLKSSLDLGMKTTKIEIKGFHMIALYADNGKVLFNQEKNISTQMYQFETIVRKLRLQGKSFTSLDVRFDKPVIVF